MQTQKKIKKFVFIFLFFFHDIFLISIKFKFLICADRLSQLLIIDIFVQLWILYLIRNDQIYFGTRKLYIIFDN